MPAVSSSRISPTMMMFGSWRRMERRPFAKVRPVWLLTWIWVVPSREYSIGSSMVMMDASDLFKRFRMVYRVVVLPEPVGPLARIMPYGLEMARSTRFKLASLKPRSVSSKVWVAARTRRTAFSP